MFSHKAATAIFLSLVPSVSLGLAQSVEMRGFVKDAAGAGIAGAELRLEKAGYRIGTAGTTAERVHRLRPGPEPFPGRGGPGGEGIYRRR
jgi:hypothetical protein